MTPAFATESPQKPRRLVAIQTNMGILPQYFFPQGSGRDFELTPYLAKLAEHRQQLTVFSGVHLPGVTGGHAAEKCFLTGTPHPDRGGFRNGISLDQFAAEQVGHYTRFPSLVLAVSNEGQTLSFTRSGAPIPAERSAKKLFHSLFTQNSAADIAANVAALQEGRSLLDFVGAQANRLGRTLGGVDRARLDQYLTAVRELEQRLHAAETWETKPRPQVAALAPEDMKDAREFVRQSGLMYDVMKLALETDSTRVMSLFIDTVVIHNITHHGNRPETLAELQAHEAGQFGALNQFLTALASVREDGESLLERTAVLYGTCMGSANSHSNANLPALIAGGGFRHGQHLAFSTEQNYPLTNVYLSLLQRLGVEVESFSSSTGTCRGLEWA
jgi:hypothetical protein